MNFSKSAIKFLFILTLFTGTGLSQEVFEFTNCGQTGRTGPSQSQCNSAYSGTNLDGLVTVNAGIQEIVMSSGKYVIEVNGAEGSHGDGGSGGQGARMIGEFYSNSEITFNIVAGQMGTYGGGSEPGGGGGGSIRASTAQSGGAGGSGVVILRMGTNYYTGTITGSPTVTTDSSDTIIVFTGDGTYTS